MTDRAAVAREAMRVALQVRRSLAIPREHPVNPFEIAQSLGIDVWFTDTPSLEGMFARNDDARILLPSLNHRPLGRLCFSCAHEIGHAQLGHGTRVDQYVDARSSTVDPEEIAADVFASSLLMPRPAVLAAFQVRGLDPATASGLDLLSISFEMCVGLEALVNHLRWGLNVIEQSTMERLLKLSPKLIRNEAFGSECPPVIVPIDPVWRGSATELEVGHAVAIPADSLTAESLSPHFRFVARFSSRELFLAVRPGIAILDLHGHRIALRVARAGFTGQWRYRYLAASEQE